MSCEVVCVLKICPLWQTLYQNAVVKVERTDEIKVKMLLGKQKQVVGEKGFQGAEATSFVRNKGVGYML